MTLFIKKIFLFCMLVAASSFAYAQSENTTNGTESGNDVEQNEQTEKSNSKPKPKEKVFKPSEEISEDSPVPFPVDI